MKLTILGTGNAMVTKCYNTCFAIEKDGHYFLVDGGGGNTIMKQLKDADIDWREITDVFVTHKHVDHIMGIIWIMRLFGQNIAEKGLKRELNIYGHEEVIQILHSMAELLLQKKHCDAIGKQIHMIKVKDGESRQILGQEVTFFDIQSTKAKQFGFSMDLGNHEKLTCCGDEPFNPCEEKYAKDSKWLLHEAFCLYGQADKYQPYKKHHSTVKDACELAEALHIKNLILYHTEDATLEHRKELYTEEGSMYYHGTLYVPDDLDEFEL